MPSATGTTSWRRCSARLRPRAARAASSASRCSRSGSAPDVFGPRCAVRLEGDGALAAPVGEGDQLRRRGGLAGEDTGVAAALPRDRPAAIVAEGPVLDPAALRHMRTYRGIESVAGDDRVRDRTAALPVVDGRRVATGRIVVACADRL